MGWKWEAPMPRWATARGASVDATGGVGRTYRGSPVHAPGRGRRAGGRAPLAAATARLSAASPMSEPGYADRPSRSSPSRRSGAYSRRYVPHYPHYRTILPPGTVPKRGIFWPRPAARSHDVLRDPGAGLVKSRRRPSRPRACEKSPKPLLAPSAPSLTGVGFCLEGWAATLSTPPNEGYLGGLCPPNLPPSWKTYP